MFDYWYAILQAIFQLTWQYLPYSLLVWGLAYWLSRRLWRIFWLVLYSFNPFYGSLVRVVRVADGDTIIIGNPKKKNRRQKVRFIGVDTPESVRSLYQDIMPFGKEASHYTKSRLKPGQYIFLVYDKGRRDEFGRILAYIYLLNGEFFNATLLKKGYAFAEKYPPNVKFYNYFVKLQNQARFRQKGIWRIYKSKTELTERYKRSEHYQKFRQNMA
jgi:micrococcal nuclease